MSNILKKLIHSHRSQVLLIAWFVYAGYYLCRKNYSIAMPVFSKTLGANSFDFAYALTIYSIFYMFGQFISGYFSDKIGAKIVIAIGLTFIVTANIAMGFSTNLGLFAIFMAINGLGQSTGWSGLVKIVSGHYKHEELGIAMSWWTTCYVIGGFVAVVFATFWATDLTIFPSLSWRRIFWAPAIVLFIIGIIFMVMRVLPNKMTFKQELEIKVKKDQLQGPQPSYLKKTISSSAIWIAAISYFFIKFTRYAFLFWLPYYFTQSLKYTTQTAGYTSSLFEIFGFAGVLLAGYISDKLYSARRFPVASLMMFGLALIMILHYNLLMLGYWGNFIAIAFIGIFTYGPDSIISGAMAVDLGKEAAGTTAGFINGIGSAGQIVSPFAVALISAHFGWEMLFKVFVFTSLASALLLGLKWNYEKNLRKNY